MSLAIDSDFDGGNIRCLAAPAPDRIRLEIVPDAGGAFFQWFYFDMQGAAGEDCVLRIENASGATYPEGWKGIAPLPRRMARSGFGSPPTTTARRSPSGTVLPATRCVSPTSRLTRWRATTR